MKRCTRCKETKERTQFNIQKSTKDGLNGYCRTCCKEKYDERMSNNNKKETNWEGTKKCRVCEEEKQKTDFNINRIVLDGIDSRCKQCNSINEKKHRKAKGAHYKNYQKKRHHENPLKLMYYKAKSRSKSEGIPFDIEQSDLKLPEVCPVLGISIIVGKGAIGDGSPSIDKFIPALGYVKGNVNVISMLANMIKTSATSEQVMQVANWMKQQEENNNE